MNLIKGTTQRYETMEYAAKVAFNAKFVDYFKENADSEVEVFVNPNNDYHAANVGIPSNSAVFVLNESYALVSSQSKLETRQILGILVEKIDHSPVTNYNVSISAEKIVYISNRPLFSSTTKQTGDDSDIEGGVNAGTFILVSLAGQGLVLYWTSVVYETIIDLLVGTNVVELPAMNNTTDAKPNTFYAATTPISGAMNLKLPLASSCKGATITAMKVAGGVSPLSIIRSGLNLINGQVGWDLDSNYDRITVFSTGTEWLITEISVA